MSTLQDTVADFKTDLADETSQNDLEKQSDNAFHSEVANFLRFT